jgi:hypothetical protein
VQFTAQKARNAELQAPPEYWEALNQLQQITSVLTDREGNGLIYAALDQTSDQIHVALSSESRATQPKERILQNVQGCLAFYDDHFEDFDMLTLPISYGTDVGESDEVEIIRISPIDATMIKGEDYGTRKLAGIKLGNFGAFFSRNWRENDMVWGRLDAVECLIKAVWPEGEEITERDRFINEAHDVIIAEFMEEQTRNTLFHAAQKTRRKVTEGELEKAVDALLMDRQKQIQFFRKEYEPDPDFPADSTVNAVARSTTVLGQLMGGLSQKYPSITEPAGILARIGRFLFFILSVADPSTLPAQTFRRLAFGLYLFGFILMTAGSALTAWNIALGEAASQLGAQVIVLTVAVQLLAITVKQLKRNLSNLKTVGQKVKAILRAVLAGFVVLFLLVVFLASSLGIVQLVWEFPEGGIGGWFEALKRILNP